MALDNNHSLTCSVQYLCLFNGVCVTRSLVLCVMFCILLFVLLPFYFWPLCCLSFDLRILITSFGIFKLILLMFINCICASSVGTKIYNNKSSMYYWLMLPANYRGGSLKLEKNMIFWRKIVIFHGAIFLSAPPLTWNPGSAPELPPEVTASETKAALEVTYKPIFCQMFNLILSI